MNQPSTINRIAVMLIPTEACLDWINSCDDDKMTLDESQTRADHLSPSARQRRTRSQVRRHYEAMFEEELNSWYTEPTMWPKDLSFKMFKKFFTIQVSSMVFDLGKGIIVKEDEE